MRKLVLILIFGVIMAGCASTETFETLGPIQHMGGVVPQMAQVRLALPENASQDAFYGGEYSVYECDAYLLIMQTLAAGDFQQTVESLSGFTPEKLMILESSINGIKRFDWVWTSMGEDGDILCRASVWDDGNYHYSLTAMTAADNGGSLAEDWNEVFASFALDG